MATYQIESSKEEGNSLVLNSRQLLLRDLFTLILEEKHHTKNTLKDWLMRDKLHQQSFNKY